MLTEGRVKTDCQCSAGLPIVALISHTEVGGSEWVDGWSAAGAGNSGNNHNIPYTTLLQGGGGAAQSLTIQLTLPDRFLHPHNLTFDKLNNGKFTKVFRLIPYQDSL